MAWSFSWFFYKKLVTDFVGGCTQGAIDCTPGDLHSYNDYSYVIAKYIHKEVEMTVHDDVL